MEGTPLKDKIFAEFDEFIAMNIEEKSESKFDEEESTIKKITFDTDYKIKTSLEEPPTDLELKPLLDHLEYAFLEEPSFLPVIISSQLSEQNKNKLVSVFKIHKHAFAWKTTNIPAVVDYVSKWAEAQALPNNDARVVISFLKKLFCHFGMPKAIISDQADEKRMFQLRELDELRHQAYENSHLYKA
ncbi:reverse transcriptase domain-containing protein [Tanacetum coccineum]